MLQLFSNECFLKSTEYTKSYVCKWISVIPHYASFLLESIEGELSVDTVENISVNPFLLNIDNKTFVSRQVLGKNFAFRLFRQDRFYDEISYPINIIKRLIYKNGKKQIFDNWLSKSSNEIKIFIDDKGNYLKFNNVSDFVLVNNEVYVIHSEGREYKMYTPLANGKMDEMKVSLLKNISIDHYLPVYEIMNQMKRELPIIKSISDELLRQLRKPYTSKKVNKKIREISLFDSSFVKQINLDLLFQELELIDDRFDLQLVDRKENTKKGKKVKTEMELKALLR